jgi:hypothetical protein
MRTEDRMEGLFEMGEVKSDGILMEIRVGF